MSRRVRWVYRTNSTSGECGLSIYGRLIFVFLVYRLEPLLFELDARVAESGRMAMRGIKLTSYVRLVLERQCPFWEWQTWEWPL